MAGNIVRILWLFSSLISAGCGFYDFEKVRSEKLIGNIYVVNLNIPEESGYYLVFRKGPKREEYLFEDFEYVAEAKGNDSLLLVRTQKDSVYNYHLIRHINGNSILSSTDLTVQDFIEAEKKLKIDYNFDPGKN